MKWTAIVLGAAVLMATAGTALAEPVRSNGAACDSTGTARRDGTQDGKKVNCQFDTCTYKECSTSGSTIGNCVQKTEYSNPTDCHAAASVSHGNQSIFHGNLGVQQQFEPTQPPRHVPPRVNGTGGMVVDPGPTTHKPPFGTVHGLRGLQMKPGNGGGSGSGIIQ